MKTSELIGPALDWAVAVCEKKNGVLHDDGITRCIVVAAPSGVYKGIWSPTVNWAQGGPIIERERIGVWPSDSIEGMWAARPDYEVYPERLPPSYGPTPLIAAMRCYVASKLGDTVEVPDGIEGSSND